MKKVFVTLLSLTMVMSLLAGCGSNEAATDDTASEDNQDAQTELSGSVSTNGSTSMESVMGYLTEGFKEVQPGVTINYTGSGSGAGVTGAQDGTCDIGLASRDLHDDETGVTQITVAKDGIAIIVNPNNPVADLSIEQIAQIFTGEITNWSELGGADAEIAVFGREAGSGTRGAFEEIVGVEDACKYTNEYSSTGDVIGNVASNPNAIGYASLSAVDDTVKAVAVNGVTPSEDTVKDGSYEIQRPFVMVTKEGTQLSEAAQAFLDFAMSADAAEIIAVAGAVSANA